MAFLLNKAEGHRAQIYYCEEDLNVAWKSSPRFVHYQNVYLVDALVSRASIVGCTNLYAARKRRVHEMKLREIDFCAGGLCLRIINRES